MEFDSTLTITGIIAICAIVSPLLTALINNRHIYRLKQLEINSTAKKEILNDFIDATLSCNNSYNSKIKFYKELNRVLNYVDVNSSKKLGKIKFLIEADTINIKEVNSALMDFIIYINKTK